MLTISIKIADDRDKDIVTLANGERFYFSMWLKNVELAVAWFKEEQDTPPEKLTDEMCSNATWAQMFLKRCGIRSWSDFDELVNDILPKLKLPPDSPMATRRCAKCGSKIWGRESLLTGIGGGCRHKNLARKSARQIRAMAGG